MPFVLRLIGTKRHCFGAGFGDFAHNLALGPVVWTSNRLEQPSAWLAIPTIGSLFCETFGNQNYLARSRLFWLSKIVRSSPFLRTTWLCGRLCGLAITCNNQARGLAIAVIGCLNYVFFFRRKTTRHVAGCLGLKKKNVMACKTIDEQTWQKTGLFVDGLLTVDE